MRYHNRSPLSWNEIRNRALEFSKEWAEETSEDAEGKSFWDGFFNVFGISRRRVATFEKPVRVSDEKTGYIDLLWKGLLLVEHKSRGKDLDRAFQQAKDYFPGLKERDLPRYILVSDFARFRLYDLENDETHEFTLEDLVKQIRRFGFIAGYEPRSFGEEDPVNIKAAELLGKLHDLLKEVGYKGHHLELFLVRLLFCLFADDSGIFERGIFHDFLDQRTAEDGSNLGPMLAQLFETLNTPSEKRLKNLDEQIAAFPYINGRLFEDTLPLAAFDRKMRETLLDCCATNWERISPAIFGSLFQSIMDLDARRSLGAHYTSETNILKALGPLFLDSLRAEFDRIKRDAKKLEEFHKKLVQVRVLDPACGCGNFLVVAYRELRLIELEVLRALYHKKKTSFLDVEHIVRVNVDQFYGIEIEDFPIQIAYVALWLTDHQMNQKVSLEFGQYFARLPLRKAPNIVHGNALRLDWKEILKPNDFSYIVGNPPFIGKAYQNDEQKADLNDLFKGLKGGGVLDYVAGWYKKTAEYLRMKPFLSAAFVSTNSITQGEQAGILWPHLLQQGLRINFAHRTFQWSSEAPGKSAVHCVIIGFAWHDEKAKWIFDYETPTAAPHVIKAKNINPYLVDAPDLTLDKRRHPICPVPPIVFGSMPNDGGHLLLSADEKADLVKREPQAARWIRKILGADEFLNNIERWCLWMGGITPQELKAMPAVLERVEAVRKHRLESRRTTTRELASRPTLFGEIRHPSSGNYLLIPRVSSELRSFIPVGFLSSKKISTDANLIIPRAGLYHFGVLSSTMHMAWVRSVCGRLENRYRYSAEIVYNNFPWPAPTLKSKQRIEKAARAVLEARSQYPKSSLAELYDPVIMPPELVKAHKNLDKAVDLAYRRNNFTNDARRVAFLFALYQELTDKEPLFRTKKSPKKKRT